MTHIKRYEWPKEEEKPMVKRKEQLSYTFHDFATVFPLISTSELESLADDIKKNGLLEDIWLYEGKILDGRNRYLACKKANITPRFKEFTGSDALSFVVSKNHHRRHLTTDEKIESIRNLISKGWSQELASKELGISRSSFLRKTHSPSVKNVSSDTTCDVIGKDQKDKINSSIPFKKITIIDLEKNETPEQIAIREDFDKSNRIDNLHKKLQKLRNDNSDLSEFNNIFKEIDAFKPSSAPLTTD
jgi:predicted DNA-binding protein (UPF0251 family)